MTKEPDGAKINYLAATFADILTRDADVSDIKRLLFFIDGVRSSLNTILACKLFENHTNAKK